MKTITRLFLVMLLAVALVLAAPVNTTGGLAPKARAIIYNQAPITFTLARYKNGDPDYRFEGLVTSCEMILDVRTIMIYSPSDSTMLTTIPWTRFFNWSDSCVVESFSFGVHGGALRKQIEKPGLCSIIVHGVTQGVSFEMTELGEKQLLEIILKARERSH